MGRRKSDSPNWGGKRSNAGRPKELGKDTATLSFRIDNETAARCKALGGSKFIRAAIHAALSAVKDGAAERETASLEQNIGTVDFEKLPGFDAVNRSTFAGLLDNSTVEHEPSLPYANMGVACGSPHPTFDCDAENVFLTDLLVKRPETSFMARATGDSMIDAGIFEGDFLIFDRAREAGNGDIVLAFLRGELTLKRLRIVNGRPELHPENEAAGYPVIRPSPYDEFSVQGVLTGICRSYK